jgi:hypothetical protein
MSMTKGERTELGVLIRKREKVMKATARERSLQLMAEFDAASAKIFHYDEDPVWQKAEAEAKAAVAAAQELVERRCAELGIPAEFAPSLGMYWSGRGHNAVASRRQELRRAAKSRIEAIEAEAIAKIERLSLEAQTEVIANGLESAAAKSFLQHMPSVEALMPSVPVTEIQSLVEAQHAARHKQIGWLQ